MFHFLFPPAAALRCECNGRSRYCLRDAWGLRCVDCQGNTEGRRCERCKDGFYQQEAGPSCTPCRCNPAGESAPVLMTSSVWVSMSEHLVSLQGPSAPRVTAGGAAAAERASPGTTVTAAPTDRSDRRAAHRGEDRPHQLTPVPHGRAASPAPSAAGSSAQTRPLLLLRPFFAALPFSSLTSCCFSGVSSERILGV